ncbi:CHAD domain-containing protein [Sulfurimonas sp. HSL3-2]|uniref:CHAD domain-containing protein n=1 Tax=Hydrocurvibacter mobilis TaxID=3131936 RepID=UPI0031F8D4B7
MGFKRSFKNKIAAVERLYKKLHLDNDIELLHKYRINLRKLYAYSEVYGKKADKKSSEELSRILKKLLKPTSALRDLDLFLVEIEQMECVPKTKTKLHKIFTSKREKRFRSFLNDEEYKKNIKQLNFMLKKSKLFIYKLEDIDKYAIISKMGRKIYDKFHKIDYNTSLEELHNLRIEFKKFRYALEAYEKHFKQDKSVFDGMYDLKEVQESFGIIQDNNKRLQFIDKVEKKFTKKELRELKAYFDLKIRDAKRELFTLISKVG